MSQPYRRLLSGSELLGYMHAHTHMHTNIHTASDSAPVYVWLLSDLTTSRKGGDSEVKADLVGGRTEQTVVNINRKKKISIFKIGFNSVYFFLSQMK